MPNFQQIAMTAVRAIRPDVAEQAEKELNNYTPDKAGLQKVVARYGGEAFLNKAVDFANTAPRVKKMFAQFGIKPEALKDNIMKELQNSDHPAAAPEHRRINPASSSRERLNKLK